MWAAGFNTLVYNTTNFGNDTVTSFDSIGDTAATQDKIDLSALGVTAANFATRVNIADVEDGAVDDTLITVVDGASTVIGTIRLEELEATGVNGVTIADFTLAAAAPATTITGTNASQHPQRGGRHLRDNQRAWRQRHRQCQWRQRRGQRR